MLDNGTCLVSVTCIWIANNPVYHSFCILLDLKGTMAHIPFWWIHLRLPTWSMHWQQDVYESSSVMHFVPWYKEGCQAEFAIKNRDIVDLGSRAWWEVSFARVDPKIKAIVKKGWGPLNVNTLLHDEIQLTEVSATQTELNAVILTITPAPFWTKLLNAGTARIQGMTSTLISRFLANKRSQRYWWLRQN